jgi:DNA-binding transcriptional ArsR family regulator
MNAESADAKASAIAAAIGELARARMLYYLVDGHAHTSTELAAAAEVSASTASAHLQVLKDQKLVKVLAQGRHRYYSLDGPHVAAVLESLSVLAGSPRHAFTPNTPDHLRGARSCYDHIAGTLGVSLHDRFKAMRWLDDAYQVTRQGLAGFQGVGIDVEAARAMRRRFAFACVDWSERRPHLAGALGAEVLKVALKRKWVVRDLDSRALEITSRGRSEMASAFGLPFAQSMLRAATAAR